MKRILTLVLSSLVASASFAQEEKEQPKEEPEKKGVWKKGDSTGIKESTTNGEKKKTTDTPGLKIVEEDYVPPVDVLTLLDTGHYHLSGQGLTLRMEYFNPKDPKFKNAVFYMVDKSTGIEFHGVGSPKEHPKGHGLVFQLRHVLFITKHPGNDSVPSYFPKSVFLPKEVLFQVKDDKVTSVLIQRTTANEWRRLSLDKHPLPKSKISIEAPSKKK